MGTSAEEVDPILFAITILAFSVGLVVVPVVRRLAIAVGMVDRPDAHRKIHRREIAVGGGIAVLITAVIALSWFALLSNTWEARAGERLTELLGLAVGAGLLCAVGLLDDWKGLAGKKKLLGQAFAASIIVATGPMPDHVILFGFSFDVNVYFLMFLLSLAWILACINAINLIDGMDGLASSVGVTIFAALAIVGLHRGHAESAVIALAMAGSLLAFLVYNFYPASIFLGDTGSMLIGLVSGTLLLRTNITEGGGIPILVPIAVMTIPLFDTTAAIIRRKFTGRSIYSTDRGHIHHCFRRSGMNVRKTMSCIALLSVFAGLGATASSVTHWDGFALMGMLAVVGILVATRSFGHSEIVLLFTRLQMFLRGFVLPSNDSHDLRVQIQGQGNWEELWDELKATAHRMGLSRVRLDVNLPAIHESYYAEWKHSTRAVDDNAWKAIVPLLAAGRPIGRLELAGDRAANPDFQSWLSSVGELCEQVELHVALLVKGPSAEPQPVVLQLADSATTPAPKMPSKLLNQPALPTGS